MKPAVVHRDPKPEGVRHPNGVTVVLIEVDDPERLARLLKLLNDVLDSPDTPDDVEHR